MVFSETVIQQVWEKGSKDSQNDPAVWRRDACGSFINRAAYGKQTEYGWNIDHITPVSRGGGDDLPNLRPLQWENNAKRQAGTLQC